MVEYNTETISRILKLEDFELDNLNLKHIKHVPMHQYRLSSLENPLLLIENLQVCIGLYAYSKDFGFAAHMNPVVIRGDEFICNSNKDITYCNRIDDLFNAITDVNVHETVYIGISLGVSPIHQTYQLVSLLEASIDELILKLKNIGINAHKLSLRHNHIFIVDTINGNIITPSSIINKTFTKRK